MRAAGPGTTEVPSWKWALGKGGAHCRVTAEPVLGPCWTLVPALYSLEGLAGSGRSVRHWAGRQASRWEARVRRSQGQDRQEGGGGVLPPRGRAAWRRPPPCGPWRCQGGAQRQVAGREERPPGGGRPGCRRLAGLWHKKVRRGVRVHADGQGEAAGAAGLRGAALSRRRGGTDSESELTSGCPGWPRPAWSGGVRLSPLGSPPTSCP